MREDLGVNSTSVDDKVYRGSRKHVLDWVRSARFPDELNSMLVASGIVIRRGQQMMPTGSTGSSGSQEARLESFLPNRTAARELQDWWLAAKRGANTPNWDLAVLTELRDRPALVLVEAKANHSELSEAGKSPPGGTSKDGTPILASANTWANHSRIGQAIAEADAGLNRVTPGFSLSRDSCYQLSNRLAFSWKLASMGIPTVLLYLGFTGDRGLEPELRSFRDGADWEACFKGHAKSVMPLTILDRWVEPGRAGFMVLLRSRERLQDSPPAPARRRGGGR